MTPSRMTKRTLWGLLAVCLVISALVAGCQANPADKNSVAGGPAAQFVHDSGQAAIQSEKRGTAIDCMNNIAQLHTAIIMYKDDNNAFPAKLEDLPAAVKICETCPETHKPYNYDPTTGEVSCSTPGHEKNTR